MPLITALLSMLSRRIGQLVRAVFGWVILGLFGRLTTAKQTALSVALVLSLAWPLLVLGVFFPELAARAIAFVPLEKWIGSGPLRVLWIVLAIVAPLVVGAITRWAAPDRKLKGNWLRTLLFGLPLSLGFAVAFLITLVAVPVTRLAAMLRGRRDEHVFLQVKENCYRRVLDQLTVVAKEAKLAVHEEAVPTSMALATRVIKWFARGALDAIVPDDPRMLRGENVEIYLYPADLLLRGKHELVARFRATMAERMPLDAAYQSSDPDAQHIEDELAGLWAVIERHHDPKEIGGAAVSRLESVAEELGERTIPFDQWMILYANVQRLERILGGGRALISDDEGLGPRHPRAMQGPLPQTTDSISHEKGAMTMPALDPRPTTPTTELFREALDETKELVRLEVALAKQEAKKDVSHLKMAAIGFGVAAAAGLMAVTLALVALALAIAPTAIPALIIGAVLLAIAVGAGVFAWRAVPRKPLDDTRRRIETDARMLKERIA